MSLRRKAWFLVLVIINVALLTECGLPFFWLAINIALLAECSYGVYFAMVDTVVFGVATPTFTVSGTFSNVIVIKSSTTAFRSFVSR